MAGMSLTVLGCCGSYPGPGQACSGYLVRAMGTSVWVDAGTGTLANLQRHVPLAEVDAVVSSHEHPDHWMDLTGAYVAAKYYLGIERLAVYAPASLQKRAFYRDAPIDWSVVTGGDRVQIGALSVTFSRTDHPTETLAMRIDADGRSLAYSADTGPGWSLSDLGAGIDVALCEATYLAGQEGRAQHLSARQAGQSCRDAAVARVLLTHLEPGVDRDASRAEGAEAFGADVELATEGETYVV